MTPHGGVWGGWGVCRPYFYLVGYRGISDRPSAQEKHFKTGLANFESRSYAENIVEKKNIDDKNHKGNQAAILKISQ